MFSILDPKWHIFIKVSELGSLTKAANVLDVPQSLVSRHIATLEGQCNSRLFRRTGRGVVLTEFGEQILPRVLQLLNDAEELADDIVTSKGNPMGEVRVGLLPSAVPVIGAWLFRRVRELYPLVRLHMCEGPSAQLEEQLNEGRIDMAMLLRDGDGRDTQEKILSQPRLRLVGLADAELVQGDTVPLRQLQGIPLVVPSRPHPLRGHLDRISRSEGVEFNCAIEADSINLQNEVVLGGGGYAITSGVLPRQGDTRIRSALITDPELIRSVVLGTTVRRPATLATRRVQQLFEKEVPSRLQD